MNKRKTFYPTVTGASMLIAIFAILSLVSFSLLTLNTSLARQRLSDGAIATVKNYYELDLKAEEIFAQIRNGDVPDEVVSDGGIYQYQCSNGENAVLYVDVEQINDGWKVLRWQLETLPFEIDESITVWDGQ